MESHFCVPTNTETATYLDPQQQQQQQQEPSHPREYQCPGCNFPKKLHLKWVQYPEDFDYFVRITKTLNGLDDGNDNPSSLSSSSSLSSAIVFQGFYRHSSVTYHSTRRSLPTRQLNIDLWHEGGEDSAEHRLLNELLLDQEEQQQQQQQRFDGEDNVEEGRANHRHNRQRIMMMVIAVRKKDLSLSLMYASNRPCYWTFLGPNHQRHHRRRHPVHHAGRQQPSSSFVLPMKQIHAHNTHRYDYSPTFTFGELAYHYDDGDDDEDARTRSRRGRTHNGGSRRRLWQLRVVCGTYDESVFSPDENAMISYYRAMDGLRI
jgi:hypothetical protein